jgi:hypothetical protein
VIEYGDQKEYGEQDKFTDTDYRGIGNEDYYVNVLMYGINLLPYIIDSLSGSILLIIIGPIIGITDITQLISLIIINISINMGSLYLYEIFNTSNAGYDVKSSSGMIWSIYKDVTLDNSKTNKKSSNLNGYLWLIYLISVLLPSIIMLWSFIYSLVVSFDNKPSSERVLSVAYISYILITKVLTIPIFYLVVFPTIKATKEEKLSYEYLPEDNVNKSYKEKLSIRTHTVYDLFKSLFSILLLIFSTICLIIILQ